MQRKMKIAFITQPFDEVLPPNHNSIGILIYESARRLARSCEVTVYIKGGWFRKKETCEQGVRYQRIPVGLDKALQRLLACFSRFFNAKRPPYASKLYYRGYISRIGSILRVQQCDIVHIINFSQFVPVIRAFNPRIRIVLHMHCEWLTQLDRAIIERRLSKADLIIGCSDYITQKIRHNFPRFSGCCETVHNGVDSDRFVPRNDHNKAEKSDAKRLLFVGRVSPEKGVHVLLNAFQRVVQRYPQAHLEIVGPKKQLPFEYLVALSNDDKVAELASFYGGSSPYNYAHHLQDMLGSLNIARQVTFAGVVPNLQLLHYYRNADIFIFPSVWEEPFGMPPLEAMSVEVPVVATRSGGIVETVENGKTGLLVERNDVHALAEAILRLLSNEDLRQSMGKSGRKRVVEFFSFEQMVENFLRHYKNLCAGFPP